ncbi:hypothetical protein NMY22_g17492 [Coprinellus aureogranulatus]|nr:hypothetical protein NMY22_g17492 [Coprinellus aureogranulatus]
MALLYADNLPPEEAMWVAFLLTNVTCVAFASRSESVLGYVSNAPSEERYKDTIPPERALPDTFGRGSRAGRALQG